jgi:hypothetical protein
VAARRYQATARIEKLSPRLYEEQQMEGDFPPFEVLKLIRDRIITNVNDLDVHESRFYINKDHLVKALLPLGWIELTKHGKITPT